MGNELSLSIYSSMKYDMVTELIHNYITLYSQVETNREMPTGQGLSPTY